jgi:hypothetical protein
MNLQILKKYIEEYKINFEKVNQQEIYKWKAVKCFQDNWDINATDFGEMIDLSLSQTKNLMDSGQYFPRRMISKYAKRKPEYLKELFKKLYNENEDLYERIRNFKIEINELNSELFKDKFNSYQDHRAIMVYLALRYPERYYFYKFEMFKVFSEKVSLIYQPVSGRIENIGHFNSQCDLIRYELSLDQELLKLHNNRITSDYYYDENLNILTQDFIYAVVKHLNLNSIIIEPEIKPEILETISATQLTSISDKIDFNGRIVNFIQNGIENKHIGDLGELWVMKYEINKLKNSNNPHLIDKIKHVSKDEGDGTGFDILSYDIDGNKMFIEVKTTKGVKNSIFFISRNELERSKLEKENYYLYRIYNFNEKTGNADLLIIKGDLTNICDFPLVYKINLKN